jgi:hypothetical protein
MERTVLVFVCIYSADFGKLTVIFAEHPNPTLSVAEQIRKDYIVKGYT